MATMHRRGAAAATSAARGARRLPHALLAAALFLSTLALVELQSTEAGAHVSPIAEGDAAHVTADALPTVQINGVVWDQEIIGNTAYAVGEFTSARPAGGPAGNRHP